MTELQPEVGPAGAEPCHVLLLKAEGVSGRDDGQESEDSGEHGDCDLSVDKHEQRSPFILQVGLALNT